MMGEDEIGARLSLTDRPKFSSEAERAASDVRKLGDTTEHSTRRSTTGFLRMRGAFGGLYTRITGGMGVLLGAAGIGGLAYGFKQVVDSSADLQKITAQTGAVLESTGNTAHVTGKQVRGLANEINGYSMMDDDAVQKAENMLLTFTNVRNEVGKGNKIFTQATKVSADMATALGGDMTQNSLRLGKALNDPIKGVGALSRVGVTFDDQQKKTIATMVKHNNTLGAQKMILAELQKEFGGSAEAAGSTFAGALFHLKDTLQDTARDMLMPALPALTSGVQALASKGLPLFEKGLSQVHKMFKQNGPAIKETAGAVGHAFLGALTVAWHFITGTVIPVAKDLWHIVGPLIIGAFKTGAHWIKTFGGALDGTGKVIKSVTGFLSDHATIVRTLIVMVVAGYGAWKIWTMTIAAWNAVTKIATGVQLAFNAVLAANPVMLIVVGLIALAAGLIYAYKKSETFRNIVNGAFHAVASAAKFVWNWLKDNWPYILGVLTGPFGLAAAFVFKHWRGIIGFFKSIPGHIKDAASGIADAFMAPFDWVFNKIAWLWNNTAGKLSFHAPGWIPHFGGKGFSMPKIPYLHAGSMGAEAAPATAYAPGMTRMHMGGTAIQEQYINLKPSEEIVRLPSGTTVMPLDNQAVLDALGGGDHGPETPVQILLDGKVIAETTIKHVRRKAARK